MAKQHVFKIGEVEGYGLTKTAAREQAIEAASEALSGDHYPEIYEHRGHVLLLHRWPWDGWHYSFVGRPDEGIRSGSVVMCGSVGCGKDKKQARRDMLRHLADLGWRWEDGAEPPAFVTDEEDRRELRRRWEFNLWYEESKCFGFEEHNARMYWADRRQGKHAQYVPASAEDKARADALLGKYPRRKFFVCTEADQTIIHQSRLRDGRCFTCGGEVRPATDGEEALWNLELSREIADQFAGQKAA